MNSRSGNLELHPLQNVEILSTIFSFCSAKDLRMCRLVGSKLWIKASLKSWREEAVLILKPKPEGMRDNDGVMICIDDLKRDYEEERDPDLQWRKVEAWTALDKADRKRGIFLRDLQRMYEEEKDPLQLRTKPFKKFKLDGFRNADRELNWVLEKFSNQVRHLAFKDFEFPTVKCFLDTIFLGVPNLVELELEDPVTFRDEGRNPIILDDIISAYPEHQKLQSLKLGAGLQASLSLPWGNGFSRLPWDKFLCKPVNLKEVRIVRNKTCFNSAERFAERIMSAIASIRRNNPSILQLRNLDILSIRLTENGFTKMESNRDADFSMPLEQLSVSVDYVTRLKPFAETLKFLSLDFIKKDPMHILPDSNIEKVCLSHVKEFRVNGFPRCVFENLNKVETPKLETLMVSNSGPCGLAGSGSGSGGSVDITLDNPSFANVTRLELYTHGDLFADCYAIDWKGFQRISQNMPNVLHANMPLTGNAFTELCRSWPNLITLTIAYCHRNRNDRIDDEAITGLKHHTDIDLSADGERPPNITNLKQLTEFNYKSSQTLTDHSVYFGFLSLPQLQYLSVDNSEFSEGARAALRKKGLCWL